MSEYQELIGDVRTQMHIFERPSVANVEKMIEAITKLEQQLKAASRYFTFGESFIDAIKNHIVIEESGVVHLDDMVIDNPSCCRMFEDGAILFIAEQHSIKLNEYANNLEGK